MKKLTLDLDTLSVQSFVTSSGGARQGTVKGAEATAECSAGYWTCNACETGGGASCQCSIGEGITNNWTCGAGCGSAGDHTYECSAGETICGFTNDLMFCDPFTDGGDESHKMPEGCGSGLC